VANLTEEKEWEIYALYSYLVDLHISQVRPNLNEKNYIPSKFNKIFFDDPKHNRPNLEEKFWPYFHQFRESENQFVPSHHKAWEEAKEAAPKNDHPDDRGTEFDVEWTNEQKFPHVATRLGFPEF